MSHFSAFSGMKRRSKEKRNVGKTEGAGIRLLSEVLS